MPLWEFQIMEPREFFNKLEGWVEKQKEDRMWLMYVGIVTNPFIEGKDKPSTFQQFLENSQPAANTVTTKEGIKALLNIKD